MICLNAISGGAEEEGGAFFILGGAFADVIAEGLEIGVDDIHRDGAMVDVDEAMASVEFEEADGEVFARFGALEVWGDL